MAARGNGSQHGNGRGSHSQEASHDDEGDALPTSELTRPSPDAILADEADPDTLLGMESDSDGGSSRPASMLPPGKRTSKRVSRQLLEIPLDDDGVAANGSSPKAVDSTPTQTSFNPSASSGKRASVYARNETELRGQVSELTTQVTSLNNKLVTSFMRIGDLEDDISQMQEAITSYRQQVATLEKEREEHLAALNTGLLVEKEHVSNEMQKMMERLIQETAEKGKAVDERQKIESELDELSSSLFSEANKMVAVERLARARAEEKSKSMEERLKDTEEIVGQQQKRLVELQGLVEKAELREKDAEQTNAASTGLPQDSSSSTGPPSLITISQGNLRLDIIPYVELRAFLNHLRKLRLQLAPFYTYPLSANDDPSSSTHATPYTSRTASPAPSQSGLSAQSGALSPSYLGSMSASTSASPFTVANVARHKDFPSLPANVEQLIHLPNQVSSLSFLKRINEEDSEPCLRLDVAPGLNWLSRRQLQSAILDGSLMIEPIFGGGIYDEVQVRQRAIGAPPAACAMCGKAVVNVPLPGGGNSSDASSWMSAASTLSAGMNAMTNSLPGRDSTASPPPSTSSFSSSAASSNRDGGKAKTGILSSLRNISGSSSWSLASSTASETASSATTASASTAAAQAQIAGVLEDPFAPPRPPAIPTHIFRISESSQSRYLLCPNYCLRRLRAACDFWGYIRNLERAVVLEGKLAWDDEANSASEATKPPNATVSEVTVDNAEKVQEESAETPRLPTKDSELSKGNLASDEKDEEEISKETEEVGEDEKKSEETTHEPETAEEDSKEKDKAGEQNAGVRSRKVSLNQTQSDAEDSDFADAQSQHSESSEKGQDDDGEEKDAEEAEEDKVDATVKVQSDKADEKATEPSAEIAESTDEVSVPGATLPASEALDGEKKEQEEDDAQQKSTKSVPPPLPKTTRPRPVPARPLPSTPPTLPPRRSFTPATPPVRHDSPVVDLGPEPRRLLPLSANQGDSAARETVWEEKVWLEVNRLRADMWSARIGVE